MIEQLAEMPRYEAYKDSGVEWLGDIPAHWEIKRFKFLYRDFSQKGRPKAELLSVTQNQGVVPRTWVENRVVMPSGNLESFKFIEKGDFAISLRSFEGGLEYCHHDGIISPAYTVLKSKLDSLYEGYYRFLFKSHVFISELQTSIVGIREGKNISYEELSYSLIPIPFLPEQTTIAAFLDSKTAQIDQAVAIKEQQIDLLKERKQIVIQNVVTRGLDPNVPMRDSGVDWIGEVPAHWEVTRLKYIFSETNERTKTGQEVLFSLRMEQGLVPHNDVSDKHIADDNLIDYKIIRPGQMIMNRMRAAIGIFGLADKFGLVSPDYAVFNIGQNAFPEYFLRFFKTPLIGEQFRLNSKGLGTGSSGFMRLYTENFGDIKVSLPSKEEQINIVIHIETQSAKIEQAIAIQQQQIDKLKEYKATLINSAVTGKIRVPEVVA